MAHSNWACREPLVIQGSVFLFGLRFPENWRLILQQPESKAVQNLARVLNWRWSNVEQPSNNGSLPIIAYFAIIKKINFGSRFLFSFYSEGEIFKLWHWLTQRLNSLWTLLLVLSDPPFLEKCHTWKGTTFIRGKEKTTGWTRTLWEMHFRSADSPRRPYLLCIYLILSILSGV